MSREPSKFFRACLIISNSSLRIISLSGFIGDLLALCWCRNIVLALRWNRLRLRYSVIHLFTVTRFSQATAESLVSYSGGRSNTSTETSCIMSSASWRQKPIHAITHFTCGSSFRKMSIRGTFEAISVSLCTVFSCETRFFFSKISSIRYPQCQLFETYLYIITHKGYKVSAEIFATPVFSKKTSSAWISVTCYCFIGENRLAVCRYRAIF